MAEITTKEKIDKLAEIIKSSENIVFFGGAGVSTESNIPDFRSETGLYNAQKVYGVSPEHMLSHTFFMQETGKFFDYYKHNLVFKDAKPNDAHIALAKLEKEGKLKAVITQNVDGLHQKAGSKTVFELHGSVQRNTCMDCDKHFGLDYVLDDANCEDEVPRCDVCGGIVKPDVVLYEEALDESQIIGAVNAIAGADTLIVGGTSLVVYPAAGFLSYFRGKHLVLINKDATQFDKKADLVIHEAIGKVLKASV